MTEKKIAGARRWLHRLRHRLGSAWIAILVWASESRYSELVSVIGTVVGSAVISISGSSTGSERWWTIVAGATVVAIGIIPTWAKSVVLRRIDNQDALFDARASIADAYARGALEHAPSFMRLKRHERVARLGDETQRVVDDIWVNYFSASETVRVVFFAISADKQSLHATHLAGRPGEPRDFDASEDRRGELGVERVDIDEAFEYHADANELPEEWGARGRAYVAFLTVPVRVGDSGYGLLSIDSARLDELDERDGDSLGGYASALGFYFASVEYGARSRRIQADVVDLEEGTEEDND